jgi:DNA-binding XRE family transcriptional regulator
MADQERSGYYAVPYLRPMRERAILTQAQLAEQAGIGRATVIAAERGDRVRVHVLEKLARALGVEKQALVYGPEAEKVPAHAG